MRNHAEPNAKARYIVLALVAPLAAPILLGAIVLWLNRRAKQARNRRGRR